MPEPPEFRRIIEILLGNSVEVVVIGGVAMALHGSAHLTRDIDFVYARDKSNLEALVSSLAPFRPLLRGAPAELPFRWDSRTLELGLNFTLSTDLGDLDLLGLAPGAPPYAELRERAEVMYPGKRPRREGLYRLPGARPGRLFQAASGQASNGGL